ncbi:AraC family transcriptional regulator [Chitinophaga pendula]|uniref:helix-turn-helix domain-containing protein n=1 Tax=Chitinophaga TaxID=79328 RepID=UPI000BAEF77D|nr:MULTISPECIES: AraC family transcriptional regulator [Chitinophaga]ASZ13941.1 AraC family transcriptional regulator [Chitinophaga sp. MD30]UCJ08439.1 AraC family transcriptional regulator [Chitinophaga pendula]
MNERRLSNDGSPAPHHDDEVSCMAYHSNKASLKTRISLSSHLFSFLQEGEKIVNYADGTTRIVPSQFMFLPVGNCLMSEKIADNGHYRSILLFCGNALFSSFFDTYYPDVPANAGSNAEKRPIALAHDAFLRHFLASLAAIRQTDSAKNTALLKLKVQELLLYLCTKYDFLVPYFKGVCATNAADNLLRRAVFTHMHQAVTIRELAFLCNMSLSTFKRKFADTFGTTPKQWFLRQRMEEAAKLLRKDGRKASEIYDQLGYEHLSSFVQSFKQFYGTTPGKYQRQE